MRFMNFISAVSTLVIPLCPNVENSQTYKSDIIAKILHNFNQNCLWAKFGFKTLFRISKICTHLVLFEDTSFSSRLKCYTLNICCNVVASITILLLIGTCSAVQSISVSVNLKTILYYRVPCLHLFRFHGHKYVH